MSGEGRTPGLRPRRLNDQAAKAAAEEELRQGPGWRRRCAHALAVAWAHLRPTGNRTTGYVAIGAVGALVGTSAVVGVGAAGTLPRISDIGAWLGSSGKGEAAHANGLTGDVDGKVKLPGMAGDSIQISQDGKTVLVLDEETGKVVRIDPAQLTPEQSSDYSGSGPGGLQLVSGGAFAYIVNASDGTVQRIDPVLTTPIGAPVDLGAGPLGEAAVDPSGTLWVPLPTKGQVVPFVAGHKAKPIEVAKPKHNLLLTLAAGEAVVTDATGATTSLLSADSVTGVKLQVNLADDIATADPDSVLVPAATEGSVVPVLASSIGRMTMVDVHTGSITTASLGKSKHTYGAPQVLGTQVYVPDQSDGTLRVYDTAQAALQKPIKVTGEPGDLEAFTRDGLLWVNDQNNSAAAVIGTDGKVHRIGKYATDVPTARKPKDKEPVTDNVPSQPSQPTQAPATTPPTENPATRTPQKPKKPKVVDPCTAHPEKCGVVPPPAAPGTPQVQSGSGTMTVNFSPSSGLRPTGYKLNGAPAGATVTPTTVGPDGPFTFQVRGGSCAQQYTFSVVATFTGGRTMESGKSSPVRPCVVPGAPVNLTAKPPAGGHAANVTWGKPANAGQMSITYKVTWSGAVSGSASTTSTSHTIQGLKNSQQYNVIVASSNAAGSGPGAATTANLTPPPVTLHVANNVNDGNPVYYHTQPNTTSPRASGRFEAGDNSSPLVVHCQVRGERVTHDTYGWSSDIWDKFEHAGGYAYISDLWVSTSRAASGQFSPEVWQCE